MDRKEAKPMIRITIKDINLRFETNADVFSPTSIDQGTLAMLSAVEFKSDDKVLDLGCGYGVVGILAAKLIGAGRVVMTDISEVATGLARTNADLNAVGNVRIVQGDGFTPITDHDFTLILSNPPYHTDFSVAKGFIENAFQRLLIRGRFVMVTKRLDWYRNKIAATFGGVMVRIIDGYYVFVAEKRSVKKPVKVEKPQRLSKKLERKKKTGRGT